MMIMVRRMRNNIKSGQYSRWDEVMLEETQKDAGGA